VAVLTEQRLHHVEDAAVPDDPLADGAAIQHLVAEVLALVGGNRGAADVRGEAVVDSLDLSAENAPRSVEKPSDSSSRLASGTGPSSSSRKTRFLVITTTSDREQSISVA
jgi:hypothetical protein